MVSAFEYSVAEVYVLAVHEVVFVEQPDIVEHLAPQKVISSAHHLNLRRLVPRQIAHVIVAETTALGVARAESSGHLVESHHRRRQPTARLLGIAAVALQHTHSSRAGIGMRIHEIETTAYGGLAHYGVGIEQQHILAAALTYGHVVAKSPSCGCTRCSLPTENAHAEKPLSRRASDCLRQTPLPRCLSRHAARRADTAQDRTLRCSLRLLCLASCSLQITVGRGLVCRGYRRESFQRRNGPCWGTP